MKTWMRCVVGFWGLLWLACPVFASQTITAVTLNGGATATVAPGATLTIQVDVTTTSGTRWRSIWWQIAGASPSSGCYNSPNHDSNGDYIESFDVTAPTTAGSYTVGIYVSSDNNCGSTTSGMTSNALVVVQPPPTVSSINLASTSPTNAASVAWTVTFSTNVSGVDAGDFVLVPAGGVSGASITSVTGGPSVYTVSVNTGTGSGTLGLNLNDNDSIVDGGTRKLGGTGVGNGNFTGSVYTIDKTPPTVSAIARASSSPTSLNSVAWNVTFSKSVTGVDATDFVLVQGGGVAAASIASVTGSGTSWVVTANVGVYSSAGTLGLNLVDDDSIVDSLGNKLGGTGASNGNFTGEVYSIVLPPCDPPSNIPSGVSVTCVCDNFNRTTLNPSTIFGSSWVVSTSDTTTINPRIVNSGYLRLTENTTKNAKAATVPGIFPAAGNYISVEFKHYAYHGTGADGVAVTLSDYSVPVVPGAFGGSLGYAQKTGIAGFAGGWVGVALDEYGNYSNPTEGRVGGSAQIAQSVGVRGPGAGTSGYRWMGGTSGGKNIDNSASTSPAPGYQYQVIVDARNVVSGSALIYVNRDSTNMDGSAYTNLFGGSTGFNAYTEANFAVSQGWMSRVVPDFWKISFTGSTGDSTNIHEIGGLRVCAQSVYPPSGGAASLFNAIDDSYAFPAPAAQWQNYQSGHIFMKLAGEPFKLNVAALTATGIQTGYVISGSKSVTVKLVDNSDGVCVIDNSKANYCNASCTSKTAVASQTLSFTSSDQGQKQTADFTVAKAYSSLVAIIDDGSLKACSTDSFAVRPKSFTSVTSSGTGVSATNAALTGTPVFKAGSDIFNLTVSTNVGGYNGSPKIDTTAMLSNGTGWVVGAFDPAGFSAAAAGASSSSAATNFTYGEVGGFKFRGFDPASDSASARGIFDDTWTTVDQGVQNDCIAGSYSNTKGVNSADIATYGKYGCKFGLTADSALFGRFVPDHFTLVSSTVTPACNGVSKSFSYMGQPFALKYSLEARNGKDAKTVNYSATGLTPAYPNSALVLPAVVAEDLAAANQGCDLNSRLSSIGPSNWSSGVYALDANSAVFSRPAAPAALDASTAALCASTLATAGGPFWLLDLGLKVSNAELNAGVAGADMNAGTKGDCSVSVSAPCNAKRLGSPGGVLYGRLQLANAYGSEMLDLPLSLQSQYWNSSYFQTNVDDNCSAFNASAMVFSGFTQNLAACETRLSPASTVSFAGGRATLRLLRPGAGNNGSVSMTLNVGDVANVGDKTCTAATASSATAGNMTWFGTNPAARATFGVYRTPLIFRRENY